MRIQHLILAAYDGGDEMLAEYESLDWEHQQGIIGAAQEALDQVPRL
jgi:hypothetical protein